ncbi:MAG: DUF389 domain-containing protein, partial [Pseudomonadota bacterium]|nr:DUF389 domain-containing protein [Pseudomonadota bacterium]
MLKEAPLAMVEEPRRKRRRGWRRQRALVRLGMLRSRRSLRNVGRHLTAEERRSIESEVHGAAKASAGYLVLLFCSCGIAALGLLQSSPAVVIGAMLISPLMGPILSMGLALARVELAEFRRAAASLALGSVVSLLASAMIVWASPLKAVTPEILARTRPTLLDLLVALLSGLVAAYVIFSRKGGVIAGVAIATALMPPLAVTGYGLATGSVSVAGGSFLLFITNVVAILGGVFVVARAYHFRPTHRRGRWHAAALALAMTALAAPLALSLRDIAVETRSALVARSAVEAVFRPTRGWIEDLSVTVEDFRLAGVDAVVVTHGYVPEAADAIRRRLAPEVAVNVEQIVTAGASPPGLAQGGSVLTNRALAGSRPAGEAANAEMRLRAMLQPLMPVLGIRRDGTRLEVSAGGDPLPLARYRAIETAAQVLAPGYAVR